jgi:hypothetical protein
MHEGAKQTRATIAILSNAYLKAAYAHAEWAAAFATDPKSGKKRLIPNHSDI